MDLTVGAVSSTYGAGAITDVDFVDKRLLVRGRSGNTYVVDPANGRVLRTRGRAPLTARSADGRVAVVARGRIAEIRRGGRRDRIAAGARIADVAVSRDGGYVAAAAGDDAILWTAADGGKRLRGHQKPVTSVAFSTDGERLLTGSLDDRVIEWRTATREPVQSVAPQSGPINDVAFSRNERWIVSSGPQTAALLSGLDLSRIFLLQGHLDRVTGAAFDGAGRYIFTVSRDRTVRKYRCQICGDLDDLKAFAERRLAHLGPP
jgi:WD40 repeat protein